MNIAEKIRGDLKRLFHGADPLEFVHDARVLDLPEGSFCEVVMRVPTATEAAYHVYAKGEFWPGVLKAETKHPNCRCSEKPIDPMDAVKWLTPERVVYSGPKTVVFWPDGTKTIVSLMDGDEHDEYGAFCAAIVKKMFGSTHKAKKFLNTVKVIPEPKRKKKEDKYAQMEMMPMPGTEDPDWGRKHWCPDAPVEEENYG